ncbi:MAG: hypothetical protein KatS3mg076_1404 [Candidatus Binatia bacterium]|nr:MAG: hypothetical protein KatS3mg076_1404 [Candidatus Binatia bacterium]
MRCVRISARKESLLEPDSPLWRSVPSESIGLVPTPLANQPSPYVVAACDPRKHGRVRRLAVQAAHDGETIAFRLEWKDPHRDEDTQDADRFPDACGILFPLREGNPPLLEMGSPSAPVNAWYWRADANGEVRNTIAHGLGTTESTPRSAIRARAAWRRGVWSVVLARPLLVPDQADETVQLSPGTGVRVAFAVWEGSNGERAGLKSFSGEWRELVIET